MNHVVLLGDSIFDNALYVPNRPAIIQQLREWSPVNWRASLLATDGSMVGGVLEQLRRLPDGATHLVVSTGGNNALMHSGLIEDLQLSANQAFERLAAVQREFRQEYSSMLQALLVTGRPLVMCTIYDAIPGLPPAAVTALSVFNDVILSECIRHRLPALDLRLVCNDSRDYSELSPIEPSERGGAKIVQALLRVLNLHDFATRQCVVYGP